MNNIAITGGVGSGKSTVTDYLKSKGYTVVDADEMAREMTGPGGKAMPYIIEKFGPQFVRKDGGLDREAMRDLVFRHPEYKEILEAGTTAVVLQDIEEIKKQHEAAGDGLLFFDIPLLFETGQADNYDAVWVVTAEYDIRKERIMQRDGIDEMIAGLIMDSQEEEELKISKADFVLYNNGTVAELRRAVDDAIAHYVD